MSGIFLIFLFGLATIVISDNYEYINIMCIKVERSTPIWIKTGSIIRCLTFNLTAKSSRTLVGWITCR